MSVGIWQAILILLIVLIFFGAGKLPRVMGDVAKGIKSFKAGLKDEDAGTEAPRALTFDESPAAVAAERKDEPV